MRRRSFDLPGGSVKTEGGEILLRTKGQAYRGADFEGILLRSRRDGTQLWLREVAPVVDGFAETDTEGRFDGKPSVLIQMFRVGDQNALEISKTVHEFVEAKKARLPEGLSISAWQDDASYLRSRQQLLVKIKNPKSKQSLPQELPQERGRRPCNKAHKSNLPRFLF